jgi:hypothetical protein
MGQVALAGIKEDLLSLSGNKSVKIVWSREVGGYSHSYSYNGQGSFRLMGIDTETGVERDILGDVGNYFRGKITHDGNRIVYQKLYDIWMVNWDGGNDHRIITNAALGCYWYDETTGKEYGYIAVGDGSTDGANTSAPLCRVNLADPSDLTVVRADGSSPMWLSVSRDGTRLGGSFPWGGHGGILNVLTGELDVYAPYGCWATTTPDNTYRFAIYPNDDHQYWHTFDADHSNVRDVYFTSAPGVGEGGQTHTPRFVYLNPGFITVTGPYRNGLAGNGDPGCEVYFGKLDAGITQVTDWVRITTNDEPDYFPNGWIDPGTSQDDPRIGLNPAVLNFSAVTGGGNPSDLGVSISNTGGGTLDNIEFVENASWLSVERNGSGDSQMLTNSVNISGLNADSYQTTVSVFGGNATNSATYTVNLVVSDDPLVLASIQVVPDNATVPLSGTLQLTAQPRDHLGNAIAAPITWSISGGGSVDPTESDSAVTLHVTTFTSDGTPGEYIVTASSGAVSGIATISVEKIITITEPQGGEVYNTGDVITVKWTASHIMDGVGVYLSPNNGRDWYLIVDHTIYRDSPEWGNYQWTVSDTVIYKQQPVPLVSGDYKLRVADYFRDNLYKDILASPITINTNVDVELPSYESRKKLSFKYTVHNGLTVSVHQAGAHEIHIHDMQGKHLAALKGNGPESYAVKQIIRSGMYLIKLLSDAGTVSFLYCVMDY